MPQKTLAQTESILTVDELLDDYVPLYVEACRRSRCGTAAGIMLDLILCDDESMRTVTSLICGSNGNDWLRAMSTALDQICEIVCSAIADIDIPPQIKIPQPPLSAEML